MKIPDKAGLPASELSVKGMRRTYNGLGEWVKRDACSGFDGGHVLHHVHCREVYTTRAVVTPKVGQNLHRRFGGGESFGGASLDERGRIRNRISVRKRRSEARGNRRRNRRRNRRNGYQS